MLIPPGQVALLKKVRVDENKVYHHSCYAHHKQTLIDPPGHYNTFLIHKDTFNKIQYDESFTGNHYGDREFLGRLFDSGVEKCNTPVIIEVHRKGKHGIVSETVDKTEYMGEDFLAPLRIRDVKKLTGTKTQRIDFPFVKLL